MKPKQRIQVGIVPTKCYFDLPFPLPYAKSKRQMREAVVSPVQPAYKHFIRHARNYLAFGMMLIAGLWWLVGQKYFTDQHFELG